MNGSARTGYYIKLSSITETSGRIQLGLRENRLSMGHARALITLEDQEILMKIYNKIIHEDLSVRKTEALVKKTH